MPGWLLEETHSIKARFIRISNSYYSCRISSRHFWLLLTVTKLTPWASIFPKGTLPSRRQPDSEFCQFDKGEDVESFSYFPPNPLFNLRSIRSLAVCALIWKRCCTPLASFVLSYEHVARIV